MPTNFEDQFDQSVDMSLGTFLLYLSHIWCCDIDMQIVRLNMVEGKNFCAREKLPQFRLYIGEIIHPRSILLLEYFLLWTIHDIDRLKWMRVHVEHVTLGDFTLSILRAESIELHAAMAVKLN